MKTFLSICIILEILNFVTCVITVRNSYGKALGDDFVQEVLEETSRYINNSNKFIEQPQINVKNVLLQKDSDKCSSSDECLNGGICQDKECYCKPYYVGPICQYELSKPIEINDFIFYVILIVAVIAGILIVVLINHIIKTRQFNKFKREGEYNDNKYEIWTVMP